MKSKDSANVLPVPVNKCTLRSRKREASVHLISSVFRSVTFFLINLVVLTAFGGRKLRLALLATITKIGKEK